MTQPCLSKRRIVDDSTQAFLLTPLHRILIRHQSHVTIRIFFLKLLIVNQIRFRAYEQNGSIRTMMPDFRNPFTGGVSEGTWTYDGKAKQKDVSMRVGKGPKAIICQTRGLKKLE